MFGVCCSSRKVVVLEKTDEESFGFEIQVRGLIRSMVVKVGARVTFHSPKDIESDFCRGHLPHNTPPPGNPPLIAA